MYHKPHKTIIFVSSLAVSLFAMFWAVVPSAFAANCTDHDTLGTGRSSSTVTVPATGTYRVWVRMAVPSTTADSVLMSIDSNASFCNVTAGNTGFSAAEVSDFNAVPPTIVWKWIDYRDGNTASKMDVSLTIGASVKVTVGGAEDDVAVDRIILVANNGCTPSGLGDNCVTSDTQAPTVNPLFPGHIPGLSDETLNTTTGVIVVRDLRQAVIKPQLTDDVGVASTAYTVNGAGVTLDGSNNYTFANNNDDYVFRIQARDTANNLLDKSITVKVRHPDIVRTGTTIGYTDFTRLITQWGTNNPQSDLNANGTVDYGDFVKLMTAWNE